MDDKIREEIDSKAAILAQTISNDKFQIELNKLKDKISEYEEQIRLAEQHQIEFDHKDSRKTSIIQSLQDKIQDLETF